MGVLSVCPFSGRSASEDEVGRDLYGAEGTYDPHLGYHLATYAGYVTEDGYRSRGSSGGMGSWTVTELLRRGWVDGVIHVREREPSHESDGLSERKAAPLFQMTLSRSVEEVRAGAKSRYYPVEMSGVLRAIRETPGRYAVVGIPCFIKAVRLLARRDPVLAERVAFCVSLVCGHLKSAAFAEMLAWQCGIPPGGLESIDFRKKLPDRSADRYGIEATGRNGEGPVEEGGRTLITACRPNHDLYGYSWGYGFFKYSACDYCDDVVGETADLSVGDAWLEPYVGDSAGTNVLVVRNPRIHALIREGLSEGRLHLEPLGADAVVLSQAGGFRHRRDGLAYRLHLKDRAGEWRPAKRVEANPDALPPRQRRIQEMRIALAARSHTAFREALSAGDFGGFVERMTPLTRAYDALYAPPPWKRLLRTLKRRAGKLPLASSARRFLQGRLRALIGRSQKGRAAK
jgi:coenzyme F420-reducing hydrogenase beta subunit